MYDNFEKSAICNNKCLSDEKASQKVFSAFLQQQPAQVKI